MKKCKKKRLKFDKIWVTYSRHPDKYGEIVSVYTSKAEAFADCWGPIFRDAVIVCYCRDKTIKTFTPQQDVNTEDDQND